MNYTEWLRGALTKNLGLKLLALAFSTALWFLVVGEKVSEMGLLVPLRFKGIPQDMVVTKSSPEDVEVIVAGPKMFINNLSPSEIKLAIDLSKAKEGINKYRIFPQDVKAPGGVDVVRVRPQTVYIELERLVTVSLPVKARLEGSPPSGVHIEAVTVEPEVVQVTGLKKDIEKLKEVYTIGIDVSKIAVTTSIPVMIEPGGAAIREVKPDIVVVHIKVRKDDRKR